MENMQEETEEGACKSERFIYVILETFPIEYRKAKPK